MLATSPGLERLQGPDGRSDVAGDLHRFQAAKFPDLRTWAE